MKDLTDLTFQDLVKKKSPCMFHEELWGQHRQCRLWWQWQHIGLMMMLHYPSFCPNQICLAHRCKLWLDLKYWHIDNLLTSKLNRQNVYLRTVLPSDHCDNYLELNIVSIICRQLRNLPIPFSSSWQLPSSLLAVVELLLRIIFIT